MLKFWKKSSGHVNAAKNDTNNPLGSAVDLANNSGSSPSVNTFFEEPSPVAAADDVIASASSLVTFDDEGLFDIGEFESIKEHSRLSKTLQEVLSSDKAALGYFLQYMESRGASALVHCWLDIETFRTDIQTQSAKDSAPPPQVNPMHHVVDHDSLSVSTDCDSLTADTSSLCDYSAALNDVICDNNNTSCNNSDDVMVKVILGDDKKYIVDLALTIFKKHIAQEAINNIRCPETIRNEIIENICDNDKILLTGSCFDQVQTYVYETMEKEYFDAFLGSDYFCKYQIDVLTSGNVALEDILYNETALFYFMEFLEQENNRMLLEFWIAATNFQQQLHDQREAFFDAIEAQNDAIVLYDRYFSLQAHSPLGFSDKIRMAVEQNICGENGLILDCFHLPVKIVEQILERNYLKSFLASQLFYKYLSELINTVQANGYSMNIERNKKSSSDCSGSERSFSTNSTFLALELSNTSGKSRQNNNRTNNNNNNSSMSIDTRELCDPDSLWKRKRNQVLSCGRVTELGKFETDFEPEPDRKEFNLKTVVKKFVNVEEEDRKKEEMAWQVAEMIVKDITNITLHATSNSSSKSSELL